MGASSPWTAAEYASAIGILQSGRFQRLVDALPEIGVALGRNVSQRTLYGAFESGGHGFPAQFLVKPEGTVHVGQFGRNNQPPRAPRSRVAPGVSPISEQETSAAPIGKVAESKRYEPRIHGAPAAKSVTHTPDTKLQKILVIPDMHHPYADELVWKTILAVVREMQPDIVVIIGDFCDFYSVSFHAKDPARGSKLRAELDYCNDALNELSALGVKRVQARAKRDWQHGFGWQVQTSDGATWCQFIPILSGRCVVDGKLITGRG